MAERLGADRAGRETVQAEIMDLVIAEHSGLGRLLTGVAASPLDSLVDGIP